MKTTTVQIPTRLKNRAKRFCKKHNLSIRELVALVLTVELDKVQAK